MARQRCSPQERAGCVVQLLWCERNSARCKVSCIKCSLSSRLYQQQQEADEGARWPPAAPIGYAPLKARMNDVTNTPTATNDHAMDNPADSNPQESDLEPEVAKFLKDLEDDPTSPEDTRTLTEIPPSDLAEQMIKTQAKHDHIAWRCIKEQVNSQALQDKCKRREHQIRINPHQSIPAGQRFADVLQADEVYSKLSRALKISQQKQIMLKMLASQLEARVRVISRSLEAMRQEIILAQMHDGVARSQYRG